MSAAAALRAARLGQLQHSSSSRAAAVFRALGLRPCLQMTQQPRQQQQLLGSAAAATAATSAAAVAAAAAPGAPAPSSSSAPDDPEDATPEAKRELRKQIKEVLRSLGVDDMRRQSEAIARHVIASPFFQEASSVGLYVTCERLREVDTQTILKAALEQGKQVFIPLVEDSSSNMSLLHIDTLDDLSPAPPFGILEPSRRHPDGSPRQHVLEAPYGLDLLLLPGLGFDREGRRLGRGGGYYDKLVHLLDERAQALGWHMPWLVALAFQQQVVGRVPMSSHDRHVDLLATKQEVVRCSELARRHL